LLVTCCYHLSVIWQDDAGMAKYVFNMCRLQLDFYKSHVSAAESPTSPRCVPFDFLSWVFAVWYLSAPSLSNWWGGEWWKNNISRRQLWWSVPLIDDPTIRQPGFDLPRRYWAPLNRFRTNQGHCVSRWKKWGLTETDVCPCGKHQTISHIVNSCPQCKLEEWSATALSWWRCYQMAENIRLVNALDNNNNIASFTSCDMFWNSISAN